MEKLPTKEELDKIEKEGITHFGEEISTMTETDKVREMCGLER